jgi:drug/metabolite transporter (DMT)-like permease
MTAASPPASRPVLANLLCVGSMLVWALGLASGDLLTPHAPPLALAALRGGLAALFILPVWLAVEGWAPVRDAPWGRAMVVGGVCLGIGALLLIHAQAATDAVTVAIISATMPIVGIALECLLDGRKVTARLVGGLALSVVGGLVALGWTGGALPLGTGALGTGALAAFAATLCFTWGSRATVTALPGMTALGRTAITVVTGGIVCCVAGGLGALWGAPGPDWQAFGWVQLWALVAFGIGSLAVSQLLWIAAIRDLGIGIASLHMNAASFYVMLFVVLGGGQWDWQRTFGAAIVVLGVMVAQGMVGARR